MEIKAKLSNLRTSPRKVRLVADMVRGKGVKAAQAILSFSPQKSCQPILKLLKQAMANAQNNLQLDPANLYIAKITVDEGPKFKRWRARSRGQAYEIQKKTSHISLVLEESKKGKGKKKAKAVKAEEAKPKEEVKEKAVPKEKPSFKPQAEIAKPKTGQGLKRMFRRKAF